MRAALLRAQGEVPVPSDEPVPERGEGQALVEVDAAPVNPIDLSVASGVFYAAGDETPYVPGLEGVGRVVEGEELEEGTRVYFRARGGLGGRDGSMAERTVADESGCVEVPAGVEPAQAACFGIAGLAGWLPLAWRAELQPGETVLVLGATGAVGTIAVQAAKLLGAGRVVAAARDARALEGLLDLGADATVDLSGGGDLAEAIRAAAEGDVDVTVDPLWGEPMLAALAASAPLARVVSLGQSAGAEVSVPSALVRGKSISVLGYSTLAAPPEVQASAFRRMVEACAAGRLRLDYDAYPIERVGEMWEAQTAFPRRKLVLAPGA